MAQSSKTHLARPERPIQNFNEDALERRQFIKRLTQALISSKSKKATGIVVGITGQWGSGKSSILNLLKKQINKSYNNAVIVEFNPWLVSGRDDLIREFLNELIATIKSEPAAVRQAKKLLEALGEYNQSLSHIGTFIGNLIKPGLGTFSGGVAKFLKKFFSPEKSITKLRKIIEEELEKVDFPIIILIDELDRIEDQEVLTVAQLVRATADFPNLSYVLAYDVHRVIQALGKDASESNKEKRGRAYLEKIVQLQIPIPIIFSNEISALIKAELQAVAEEIIFPKGFFDTAEYECLNSLLIESVITTPRDIKRLVGTFHALAGMVGAEVDYIDLIAYCALLVKFPEIAEIIREKPDEFVVNPIGTVAALRTFVSDKLSSEDKLKALFPDVEKLEPAKQLLTYLFPRFSEHGPSERNRNAVCWRRPLLTTLRLGLVPGHYSHEFIVSLTQQQPDDVKKQLKEAYDNDKLDGLIERLNEVYPTLAVENHVLLWKGINSFLKKPDCKWMTSYNRMHTIVHNFSDMLLHAIGRNEALREEAIKIFSDLLNTESDELVGKWLREHIYVYGLYKHKPDGGKEWFLTREQTEAQIQEISAKWRTEHLRGQLIPCRWNLMPVYTMLDNGVWDELCKKKLDEQLGDDIVLDGLTLMLYGGHFTTDQSTLEKIVTYDGYIKRVQERLSSINDGQIDVTVKAALNKVSRGW